MTESYENPEALKSPELGALTPIHLCTTNDISNINGKFFGNDLKIFKWGDSY